LIEKRILSPNGTNNSEGELHGETSIRGARSELISYAQVRRGTWTHRDRRNQARADFTRELYEVRHSQQVQTQFANVASSGGENPFAL
jgi:hypothetical protein